MSENPVRTEVLEDGALLRLVLARPPGNILDTAMVDALTAAVKQASGTPTLRAVLIEGEGDHFCYGASVEEHLPDQVGPMLRRFHGLFEALIELSRPVLTAVRGRCLGGGLELAAFGHRLFASPDAILGQPEIRLGVFAPAASLLLPRRIGQARADDLLLTGRTVDAEAARDMGLVDDVVEDPAAAARAYARKFFDEKSAASLTAAVAAARSEFHAAFLAGIKRLEALYLEDLMSRSDAEEGIRAFLEKRTPAWSHQ